METPPPPLPDLELLRAVGRPVTDRGRSFFEGLQLLFPPPFYTTYLVHSSLIIAGLHHPRTVASFSLSLVWYHDTSPLPSKASGYTFLSIYDFPLAFSHNRLVRPQSTLFSPRVPGPNTSPFPWTWQIIRPCLRFLLDRGRVSPSALLHRSPLIGSFGACDWKVPHVS